MRKLLLAVVFFIGGFASCEATQNYTYQVFNNASDEITVQVESSDVDTEITIPAGETATILVKTHYSTITEKTEHSVSIDFVRCDVSMVGIPSDRDFLSNEPWDYAGGVYTAVVTDSEFQSED